MQDQFPEGSYGLDMSPQSLIVTHNIGSQSPHRPASDGNLEISPQRPPMSAGSLLSDNPQMRNHQQMPNYSPMPECRQRNNYAPTDSYYPTHDYSTHNNPPAHGLPDEHHQSIYSRAYCSASPYPNVGTAENGPDLNAPQPNTELSNPPITQYPPPNSRGIDTRRITSAQTQTNCPAGPHVSLASNTDYGEPDKDVQSPLMPHAVPPQYPSGGLPLLPTAVPVMHNPEREIIIAVMGVTGTGKSHFIREASGIADIEVSSGLHSCTTKAQPYSFPYANAKITLVDTPGFNDTTKSNTKVLTDICAWMSSNYREGKLLSGIIYLHRITDVRMDGTSLKNFKMLQKMCGPDALQNVFLTTTQWSNVSPALGEQRENNLRHEDFWAELIFQGASLERFMGTRESGLELIRKLIEKEPRLLHIQDQMVEKGMTLVETDVGKFMNDELISLQNKYEKDLENLERERRDAIAEKDDEMEMILALELANAREKREEVAAERKLLADLQEFQTGKLEALRKRDERREKDDGAMIAINLKDIQFKGHIISLLKPHSTKGLGRLVHDISDVGEFDKDPSEVTINYQFSPSFVLSAVADIMIGLDSEGSSGHIQIIYNKSIYSPTPDDPIEIGTQKFRIFTKY